MGSRSTWCPTPWVRMAWHAAGAAPEHHPFDPHILRRGWAGRRVRRGVRAGDASCDAHVCAHPLWSPLVPACARTGRAQRTHKQANNKQRAMRRDLGARLGWAGLGWAAREAASVRCVRVTCAGGGGSSSSFGSSANTPKLAPCAPMPNLQPLRALARRSAAACSPTRALRLGRRKREWGLCGDGPS